MMLLSLTITVVAESPLALGLPTKQQYEVRIITTEDIEEYRYLIDFVVDQENQKLYVTTTGDEYTNDAVYDLDFLLLDSKMHVLKQEDVERVGFDSRVAVYDQEKHRIAIEFYQEDRMQDDREIYLQQYGTEMEVLGLNLQALLLNNQFDFHGQLVDLNGIGRYSLDSKLLSGEEIKKLADAKNMADSVRSILNETEVYAFTLGYRGILRLFFPIRFHVVLEQAVPHRILAFWGGSSNLLRYHVYDYRE